MCGMDYTKNLICLGISFFLIIVVCQNDNLFAQAVNNNEILHLDINKISSSLDSFDLISYHPLINGKKYNKYYYGIKGHQFYNSKKFCRGEVILPDKKYTNLLLRYDIFNDIVNLSSNAGKELTNIELNKNIIVGFSIDNHLFVKYEFPQNSELTEYNGFYELIYDGEIQVAFRWIKYISNTHDNYSGEFKTERTVYMINGNHFSKIKNRKDILSLFEDYEQNIKQYLRSNKFIAKKASASEYIELMKFCEN